LSPDAGAMWVPRMKWTDRKTILWPIAICVLGIVCFPANPLVFAGIIKTDLYPALFAVGWIVWGIGMTLVMAAIVMFPRRGGVPKGKSFVHTTKLVDTGIYAIVRHPQYLGGVLSIFLTTLLWYPHWLFAVLGIIGALAVYWSARDEDKRLIEKYGANYIDYMSRVPRLNIILGIMRALRHRHFRNGTEVMKSVQNELRDFKDHLREGLLKFTRKAFQMLPVMPGPKVLDIGCGSGVPTIELARLSGGEVTGVDINQVELDRLAKKIRDSRLSSKVKIANLSMLNLGFPEGSFDIIWTEGAIAVMGFGRGIKDWRRFLRSGGYLVIHDDLGGLKEKLELVPRRGYELIGHFVIGEETWWNEYYAPLDKKLDEIRSRHAGDKRIVELLSSDQREVDGFKKDPERYCSVFFVLKKTLQMD
jgi:protein-S-isoprenylcysteine O-methyltransferase Ste14/ubiquinone/menaquinone biosynthesis C-methylase UbiE